MLFLIKIRQAAAKLAEQLEESVERMNLEEKIRKEKEDKINLEQKLQEAMEIRRLKTRTICSPPKLERLPRREAHIPLYRHHDNVTRAMQVNVKRIASPRMS
jgi:hypothetical protein